MACGSRGHDRTGLADSRTANALNVARQPRRSQTAGYTCGMLKIDTHSHILPEEWPDLAEKYGDPRFPVMVNAGGRHRIYKDRKFFREIWKSSFDPEFRIEECGKLGVDVQVISTVPVLFSYWAKPNQARELHRHLNMHAAEICRRHPRHYAGIGTVPLQSPRLAIEEMEHCIEQLGLQGVQIGSARAV